MAIVFWQHFYLKLLELSQILQKQSDRNVSTTEQLLTTIKDIMTGDHCERKVTPILR